MVALTVAIVAGGQSSRMGTDKAFVQLNGRPLITHLLDRIAGLGQTETILITNHPADYAHLNLPMVSDVLPGKGSLGGIYTALHASQNSYTLALACDMPFVNPDLLRYLIRLAEGDAFDVIVPTVEGYPQGLHAIYGRACQEPIRARLDADRLKVIGFYDEVRVRMVDEEEYGRVVPDGRSFFNVNTPEDLEQARRWAEADQA
jgi:molybdopterin-guanine dinucleotide biosynthesis protein A